MVTTIKSSASWIHQVVFNDDGLIPVIAQDKESNKVLMVAWMNAESLSLTVENKVATYYSRSRQKLWKKGETSGHVQQVHSIRLDCDADVIILIVTQIGGIACHTGRESCFYKELTLIDDDYQWQAFTPVLKDPHDIYHTDAVHTHSHDSNEPCSHAEHNADAQAQVVDTSKSVTADDDIHSTNSVLTELDQTLQERKIAVADSSYVASLYAKGLNKILEKVGEEAFEAVIAAKEYQYYLDTPHEVSQELSEKMSQTMQDKGFSNQHDYLKNDLVYEVADVWFHTLVTLAWFDIGSESILQELARRFGLSGIAEKNSRKI